MSTYITDIGKNCLLGFSAVLVSNRYAIIVRDTAITPLCDVLVSLMFVDLTAIFAVAI